MVIFSVSPVTLPKLFVNSAQLTQAPPLRLRVTPLSIPRMARFTCLRSCAKMKKGSILSRIVKEISLANFADETPLSDKVSWTITQAIPEDIFGWFINEISPPPLSNSQGLKLLGWLFTDIKKAKINLKHIGLIRQARREQFIDYVTENLPTPAVMANTTKAVSYTHLR